MEQKFMKLNKTNGILLLLFTVFCVQAGKLTFNSESAGQSIPEGEIFFQVKAEAVNTAFGIDFRREYVTKKQWPRGFKLIVISRKNKNWMLALRTERIRGLAPVNRQTTIPWEQRTVNLKIQSAWNVVRIKLWATGTKEPETWQIVEVLPGTVKLPTAGICRFYFQYGKGKVLESSYQAGDDFISQVNLLNNPSFERLNTSGKPVDGWNAAGGWRKIIRPGRNAVDGNYSLKFDVREGTGQNAWIINYAVPVRSGRKYQVSGWFKTAMQELPDASGSGTYIDVDNQKGKNIFSLSTSGKRDWRIISGEFTAPDNNSYVTVKLGVRYAQGICWVDDLVIKEVTKPKSINNKEGL